MNLRPYRSTDLPSLYRICLETGANGGDGSGRCTHPDLVGAVFAAPYPVYDADSCLVLEDDEGPCGYVLGAFDSRAFALWFNQTWLPEIRDRFRNLTPPPGAFDGWILEYLDRQMEVPDFVDDYPAHLHIDLLPRVQKGGWGRRSIMAWADLAKARGARGLYLGVSGQNLNAVAFYRHIGMHEIAAEDWGFQMGMKLDG
ncbi:MAG: GNAT family N-acetyltransferase [Opitutaceae bacterium]